MNGKTTRFQRKAQERQTGREQTIEKIESLQALTTTDDEQAIIENLMQDVSDTFVDAIAVEGMTEETAEEIATHIQAKLKEEADDFETQQKLQKIVLSQITGLGPIEIYVQDPKVEDIVVQRYDNIVIVKEGKRYNVDAAFPSEKQLVTVINRIVHQVGRQINMQSPKVDARLSDGSRVNATIPPISPDGATLTIRKFNRAGFTGDDYLRMGCLSPDMLSFITKAVTGKLNVIVSGGTGSGKTTLLNMLSSSIPEEELIVTVEDSCELQLKQKNVRRLETKQSTDGSSDITVQDLVKNALRMTIDRLIVGEARDGVVVDIFSAMSTGHDGSMSTIHANSPVNLVNARIPILYSMYRDGSFTSEGQMIQVAESLDLIVQITRINSGEHKGRRVISHITAVEGIGRNGKVKIEDIFRFDIKAGNFYATGYTPKKLLRKMEENNIYLNQDIFAAQGTREDEGYHAADEEQTSAVGQGGNQPEEPRDTESQHGTPAMADESWPGINIG